MPKPFKQVQLKFHLRRSRDQKNMPVLACIIHKQGKTQTNYEFKKNHRNPDAHPKHIQDSVKTAAEKSSFARQHTFLVTFRTQHELDRYMDPKTKKFWFDGEYLVKKKYLSTQLSGQ